LCRPELVREVFITPQAGQRYAEIVEAALGAGLLLRWATPEVVDAMSPDAQGVLAVARTIEQSLPELLSDLPGDRSGIRLVAVLNNARDPGNVGTVIRAADAAGADAVVLAGQSVEQYNPKLVRSTAGSLFHLPVVAEPSLDHVVAELKAAGLQIFAADGAGGDSLLDVAGLARPTAWIFGNEAWGLSDDERALADRVVRVPIFGAAESLNLAMAATVCLYASAAARAKSA